MHVCSAGMRAAVSNNNIGLNILFSNLRFDRNNITARRGPGYYSRENRLKKWTNSVSQLVGLVCIHTWVFQK